MLARVAVELASSTVQRSRMQMFCDSIESGDCGRGVSEDYEEPGLHDDGSNARCVLGRETENAHGGAHAGT